MVPAEDPKVQAPAQRAAEKEEPPPQNETQDPGDHPNGNADGAAGHARDDVRPDAPELYARSGSNISSVSSHDRPGDLIATWSVDIEGRPVSVTHSWHPSHQQLSRAGLQHHGYPAHHQFVSMPAHVHYYRATSQDSYHTESSHPASYPPPQHEHDYLGNAPSHHPSFLSHPEPRGSYYQEIHAHMLPRRSPSTAPVEVHRPSSQTPSTASALPPSKQHKQEHSRENAVKPAAATYHVEKLMESNPIQRPVQPGRAAMNNGKGCTCRKTKCLKLYCFCFSASLVCNPRLCICDDCKNTSAEAAQGDSGAIAKARRLVLQRNRNAFQSKFSPEVLRENHPTVGAPPVSSFPPPQRVFVAGNPVVYHPGADRRMQAVPMYPPQRREEYEFKSLDHPRRFSASPQSHLENSESTSSQEDNAAEAADVEANVSSNKSEVEVPSANECSDGRGVPSKYLSKEDSEQNEDTKADAAITETTIIPPPPDTVDASPKDRSCEKVDQQDVSLAPNDQDEVDSAKNPAMDDASSQKPNAGVKTSEQDASEDVDENPASAPAGGNPVPHESRPEIAEHQAPERTLLSAFVPPMPREVGGYYRTSPNSLTEASSWETRPRLESFDGRFYQPGEPHYLDAYQRSSYQSRANGHHQSATLSSIPRYGGMRRPHGMNRVGCKCRKSQCLKKYCECFANGAKCGQSCRCENCANQPTATGAKDNQWSSSNSLKPVVSVEERPPSSLAQAVSDETVKSNEGNLSFLANIAMSKLDSAKKKRKADEMELTNNVLPHKSYRESLSHHWDPTIAHAGDNRTTLSKGSSQPAKAIYSETGGLPVNLTFRKICSRCGRQRAEHGEFGFGNKCSFSTCGRCGSDVKMHEENKESMGVSCKLAEKLDDNNLRICSKDYDRMLEELSERAKAQIMQKEQKEMRQREQRRREMEIMQNEQRFIADQRDIHHREMHSSDIYQVPQNRFH